MPDVTSGQPDSSGADIVSAIGAMIDAERVTPDAPKEPQQAEPEAQPETEEVGQPNAEVEGEEADEQSAGAVAEIPLDQLEAVELEVTYKGDDGKDVTEKLPIKKIREGFMMEKHYRQRTAELARERENVASAVRQGIEKERATYTQNLQQLHAAVAEAIAPELKNVDWNNLADTNPAEYVRLQNRSNTINQTLQSIQAKQQELQDKTAADQRQASTAAAHKTWQALQSDIPGWNEQVYQEVLKAGESVGYTTAETGQWLDARAIKLLNVVREYQKLQASKPSVDKKVVAVPKVVKPGAQTNVTPQVKKRNAAAERLQKSGRVEDLADFLSQGM